MMGRDEIISLLEYHKEMRDIVGKNITEKNMVVYGYHFGICHALEMVLGL